MLHQTLSQILTPGSLAAQLSHAAQIIARIRQGESLADGLIQAVPETDRPAVQEMVYTFLRAYGWADAILAKLLQRPLQDMWLQSLLGLAVLRLFRQSETAHTIVSQAVDAAAQHDEGRFKALTNGVLRNFQRQQAELVASVKQLETVQWAHPRWWVKHVQRDHRKTWQSILRAGNTHPPMALRVNVRQTTRADWLARATEAGIEAQAIGADGVMLTKPVRVSQLPGFFDGDISVQDFGAQYAAELLNPSVGARVLDACAAPGGKTAHLLERTDVALTALDVSPERCQRIEENLARLKLSATVKAADCREIDSWWDKQPFDAILADVPCTASGVARRHPDSKWLRQESDVNRFARTQREILDALSRVLAPGGKLLYVTCSVFTEENQLQIAEYLTRHPEMLLTQEVQLLPNAEHDGFYYALLTRTA
ncbi:MAG: hypothetical protein RIR18_402 [Pseudomonadota bacterium]|jgi:16S rRNA (cytosine967-C5)-methyltransferase